MFDIISIGDSTIDVFLELDEASIKCELKKEECKLCINYADKIPVKSLHRVDAVGNAANHAVGISRLGLHTAIWTIVGDDDSGRAIRKQLKKEGVSTQYAVIDKKHGTNYSTVINYKGERTILVYHEHRDYRWKRIGDARWIYFTSMGQGSEAMHKNLLRYIERTGAKLAVNPGTYQIRSDGKTLAPIFAKTDVLFVNKEEARYLLHTEVTDMKRLLADLHALGPKTVAITDGQKGSYAYDGKGRYYLDIFEAPIVERTGCGDAFGSGFTAALAYGYDVKEAMRWGNINASGVIQYIGAQQGLYKKDEILKILSSHPEYVPKVMNG